MVKKRLYRRHFLAKFLRKRLLLRVLANYSTHFWTTASRFFIIEPAFCECDKNHEFDNFKTNKNLFFNEVAFHFIWLHCIKSVCISLYSVWIQENADTFYAVLCYNRCQLNLIWIRSRLYSFICLIGFIRNRLEPLERTF